MDRKVKDRKSWVSGELGMKDKFRCMYQNTDMYDVEFVINGERVGAHKVVLAMSSPVFNEMFKSTACDGKNTIEVKDFKSANAFREFVKFIYLEEADVDMANVFPLIHLSKHYKIPNMEMICTSFAMDRVSPENLSHVLDSSIRLNLHQLTDICKQMLAKSCRDMIREGKFSGISHETLTLILQQNDLLVPETELALAVLQWCHDEVARKPQVQDEASGDNKKRTLRSVIGDSLYLIRFPCMNERVFAAKIAYSGLLSLKEVRDVFSYFCYKSMLKDNKDDESTKALGQLVRKINFPVDSRDLFTTEIETKPKRKLELEQVCGKKLCK